MTLYHPTESHQFKVRDALLQKSLRPEQLPFPIASEYPLVLGPQGNAFSYCYNHLGQLCSHANLWPRRVFDNVSQEHFMIGLVGNVATDPRWRGQGHMRNLLTAIEASAQQYKLAALLLWSDLSTFYQNLGFQSLGKEFHFHFTGGLAEIRFKTGAQIRQVDSQNLTDSELQRLMDLRYPLAFNIDRSVAEFRCMLTIPWLNLWIASDGDLLVGYALLGKGYDMMGVIHEWGVHDMNHLIDIVHTIRLSDKLENCILLAPFLLENAWYRELLLESSALDTLPMALIKILSPDLALDRLSNLFIWGLDSI